MRKLLTLIAIGCLATSVVNAQNGDNKEAALAKKAEAIKLMDDGKLEESVTLLTEARKLDPDEPEILYEMALAKYQQQKFEETIKLLKEIIKMKKATGRVYSMMGNATDDMGKPEKAIDIYEEGIKKFPNEGALYLERGVMEMKKKEYNAALSYFERGIAADPQHPSNYYRAAKLFLDSEEEVWGMIYGEIFMNLERGSKRTEEMSKLLYFTYKGEIKFETDTSASVSFSKASNTIYYDPKKKSKGASDDLLAQMTAVLMGSFGSKYEMNMVLATVGEKMINLASLNRIRSKFLAFYNNGKNRPVVLFDYQQKIKDAGHFEAYNYWLLGQADEKALDEWVSEHNQQWTDFMKWFKENKLVVTEENTFTREGMSKPAVTKQDNK